MPLNIAESNNYLVQGNAGFWEKKTKLEKRLVYFIGFLLISVAALIIALIVVANKQKTPVSEMIDCKTDNKERMTVCHTEECKLAGAYYSANLNQSVDPCENFYEFVCGSMLARTIIPEDKKRWGTFEVLDEKVSNTSIEQLKQHVIDTDFSALDNAKLLFQSCVLTEQTSEEDGLKQIKVIKDMIGLDNSTWLEMIPNALKYFGSGYIIAISVALDDKNTTRWVISLDQNDPGLSRDTLLNATSESDKNMVKAYKTYVKAVHCFIQKSENNSCNDSEDDKWVSTYIEFETQMTRLSRSPVQRRDPNSWYNPMDFQTLQKNISTIDWLTLIKKSLSDSGANVTNSTTVIVREGAYFASIIKYINSNKTLTSMAREYLLIRTLMSLGPYLFPHFRQLQFEFLKVINGVQKQTEINLRCFDITNAYFGHAVGKLYIEASSFDENAKKDILEMVQHLDTSFQKLVKGNSWMDDATKSKAFAKLGKMAKMIGYPDWTKSNKELDKYYYMDAFSKTDFFDNMKKTSYADTMRAFERLNLPNNRTFEWVTTAAIVNAFYDPEANSITFPAGILQSPFYANNRTKALNFGSIGWVIGHEITHGFDDQGRNYDSEGNLLNWWSPKTLSTFNQRKQCFIDQYGNVTDDITGMKIKGDLTIGENIADNGGIREAYQAYILSGEEKMTVPGLENFDDKQLFFIAAGSTWCQKIRKEALVQQILNDVHSPAKQRSFMPLANSGDFASAFGCAKDTTMNPKPTDTCVIW